MALSRGFFKILFIIIVLFSLVDGVLKIKDPMLGWTHDLIKVFVLSLLHHLVFPYELISIIIFILKLILSSQPHVCKILLHNALVKALVSC
jgi:hypothetical protein